MASPDARQGRFPLTLTLLFVLCVALASLAAVALVIAMVELTRSTRDVEHTLTVQQALETLQLTLVDAETGQRGFLLTGQADFLAPYIDAVARQAYYLGTLERLTADNPRQQEALRAVKPLVEQRLAKLSASLTAARTDDREVLRQSLNEGRELMNRVRFALQGLREEEDRLLTQRQLEVERRGRYGALFMLLSNGASLLGLTVLYVAMRGYHRRRQQMEAEMRGNEHALAELFERAAVAQAACELQGARFVRANQRAAELTGYSADELLHTSLLDLLPRGQRLDNARAYREVVEGQRSGTTLKGEMRRKDGTMFMACVDVTLAQSPAGEPLHTIVAIHDVTEREATARQLVAMRGMLSAVAEASAELVFAKDAEGRYVVANRTLQELLGRREADIVGRRDSELMPDGSDAEAVREHDRAVLASGRAQTFDEHITGDGHERTFRVTKSAAFDGSGNLMGIIGVGHEVEAAESAAKKNRA